MYVERCGCGEKVLFIHGSGWNSRMWHGQRDYLEPSMEVILVDLPGHGRSPGVGFDSIQLYADEVYGVIEDLHLEGCFIAGHSLGGAVTMSLALAHPEATKGIILIGTGAKLKVLPQILNGVVKDKEKTVRSIGELAFSEKSPAALRSQAISETLRCRAEAIQNDFAACDRFDAMDSLGHMQIPALVICGAEDRLTPPKYSQYLNGAIKGSQLVLVKDAGHMVMMEKPMEVNEAIEQFVGLWQG